MPTDSIKPSKSQAHKSIRNEGKPIFFASSEESAGYNSLKRDNRPSKYKASSYFNPSDGKSNVTLNASLDMSSDDEDGPAGGEGIE